MLPTPVALRLHLAWVAWAIGCGLLLWPATASAHAGRTDAPVSSPSTVFLPMISRQRLPPTTDLIERARERGEINAETALIYKVFAVFGDTRLPSRLRGDDRGVMDSNAVAEATQRFETLTPATRQILVPFLIPPVYVGSWYDRRIHGAQTMAAAAQPTDHIGDRCNEVAQNLLIPLETDHFVVWFPPNDTGFWQRAQRISADLETRIYPILTDLLRAPLSDAGLGCNPSDGRLDVYMVYDPLPGYESTLAMVSTYPGKGCKAAPTYMQVLKQGSSETNTVAHEFMHMIQFAYNPAADCYDSWWMESTANWAIDYFERMDGQPDAQTEQAYAKSYLESAWRWLIDTTGIREYGAYLWPFYLSHYTGSYHPELIAQIMAATENAANGDLYQVINDRIAGGWEQRWPEFALLNLNLPPNNRYAAWDNFQQRWMTDWRMTDSRVALLNDPYWVYYLDGRSAGDPLALPDLGIFYEEIAIADDVRMWALANTFNNMPSMRVQALLYRNGQGWQGPEDWSQRKWSLFCQDNPAERVQSVLVIISNSNWQRRTSRIAPNGDLRVVSSDLPCAGWRGTSSWQMVGQSVNALGQTDYTLRGEAAPTFTLARRTLTGDQVSLEFQATAGSATWLTTITAVDFQTGQTTSCTRTGGGALIPSLSSLLITEDLSGATMRRQFFGAGLIPAPERCPVFTTWTHIPWLTTDIQNTAPRPWPASAPHGRLQGSDTFTQSSDGATSTTTSAWNLTGFAAP
ncbi:hypothetical protein [Candidatus Amarolinea aalborgensis]|uniref:hypothetical protein n=1 Tax=Candidatus Amarolinea aalborgensis TaxID=2249329 RepID=UPI003BF9FB3A